MLLGSMQLCGIYLLLVYYWGHLMVSVSPSSSSSSSSSSQSSPHSVGAIQRLNNALDSVWDFNAPSIQALSNHFLTTHFALYKADSSCSAIYKPCEGPNSEPVTKEEFELISASEGRVVNSAIKHCVVSTTVSYLSTKGVMLLYSGV